MPLIMAHRFEGSSSHTITVILNDDGVAADTPAEGDGSGAVFPMPGGTTGGAGVAGIAGEIVSFSTGFWTFAGGAIGSGRATGGAVAAGGIGLTGSAGSVGAGATC